MSGQRDESIILESLVDAASRLIELGRDVPRGHIGDDRDVVAHHYDGIIWPRVAEIICDQLPPLLPRLAEICDLVRAEFDAAEAERGL